MTFINNNQTEPQNIKRVLEEILRAVEGLKNGSGFGSIEIVMHEGRGTKIEKREKLRLHNASTNLRK